MNEIYESSDAALAQLRGVASQTIPPKIFNIARITTLEVYGNLGADLQKVIASAIVYEPFAGFSRLH